MQQGQNTHQSLGRALEILLAFIPNNLEMGTKEVSERVGLNRSTASRLLQVLTQYRFLYQNPVTKKFSLGISVSELGRAFVSSLETQLTIIARPKIDELSDAISENVALEVLSENCTILAYAMRGHRKLQVSFQTGERLPIHVAAGGKSILAFLPSDLMQSFIPNKFESFTPNTITDKGILLKQLEEIRKTGFAFDRGERDIDVYVVATPIFDHKEKPVAAVVVPVPATRKESLTKPELLNLLKKTADEISDQLLL